jgi:protein-S-isoprenylcysteine O-methyltransferase Ste14
MKKLENKIFTHRFQILPEERVMSAKFGQAYAEYRNRVRRWL